MRGIVPDEIAGRSTKGEFSADIRIGLHRNTPSILESFADSALAEHGLINPDAVRTHLVTPQPTTTGAFALEALIGCETWLRTALQPTTPTRRTDAAPTAP
jgi:asparagine synthase (glutamine-hydrolysing)